MSNETKKIEDLKEFKDILLNKQRLMGLDLGSKRIGISVSDPELQVAISIKTIERNKLHILTAELNEIINKFEKASAFNSKILVSGTGKGFTKLSLEKKLNFNFDFNLL